MLPGMGMSPFLPGDIPIPGDMSPPWGRVLTFPAVPRTPFRVKASWVFPFFPHEDVVCPIPGRAVCRVTQCHALSRVVTRCHALSPTTLSSLAAVGCSHSQRADVRLRRERCRNGDRLQLLFPPSIPPAAARSRHPSGHAALSRAPVHGET